MARTRSKLIDRLSPRDEQVLSFIMRGYNNASIAANLNISENTVKTVTTRLYLKEGVTSRLDLAVKHWQRRCERLEVINRQLLYKANKEFIASGTQPQSWL